MPQTKKCKLLKQNLERCIAKHVTSQECDFYKKILHMCLKRKKNIFQSGP